jgi:hypothetical protein
MSGEGNVYDIPPPNPNRVPNPNGPPNKPPPHVQFNYRLLQAFAEATQAAVRNGVAAIISEPIKMVGEDADPVSMIEMLYDLNGNLEIMNENLEKMNELMIVQLQAAGVIEDDDDEEERPRPRRKKPRSRR